MATGFLRIALGLNLGSQAADPAGAVEGDFYTNSATHLIRVYLNGAWRSLQTDTGTGVTTGMTLDDTTTYIVDTGDVTKRIHFVAGGSTATTTTISTAPTANRTWTLPDVSDVAVGTTATQTLTNKTLTAPVMATVVNGGGTLTLPSSTDVLVGRATVDTLTNKTLTSPTITTPTLSGSGGALTLPAGPDTLVARATTDTLTNKTLTAPVIATIVNGGGTLTLPAATDVLVARATTDTLTNKSISGSTNTLSNIPNTATTATNLNTASAIVARDASGNFSAGTMTGNVTGNVSGSAATFTGALSGDVTGTQGATAVATVGGSTATNVHSAEQAANAATNLNTASTIVKRDSSGNFTASTITANLTGNVTGSATSATSFTGSLVGDVTGTQGATVVSTVGGSSATNVHTAEQLANAATASNTGNTIVKRDISGNITGQNLTAQGTLSVTGGGASIGGAVTLSQITTPGMPNPGYTSLYTKSDGKIYYFPNGGTETIVGTGSGGGSSGGNNTYDRFNGDGTTTAFLLSVTPGSIANTQVHVGGVYQDKDTYTLVAATITFSVAPPAGVPIEVVSGLNVNSTAYNGSVNYIPNANIETNATTGWSLQHTTLSSGVPNQIQSSWTAAAGTANISAISSGAISGSYSLQYQNTAATVAGDMLVSDAFTIDPAYRAKVLGFRLLYSATVNPSNANWSGTSANSFQIWLYDVANSGFIQPAGVYNLVQSSGVGIATGTFQTPSNATSFRFALVSVNATTGAITLVADDFFVGPQITASAPAMSDWQSYTPTISGVGAAASISAFWRRVGDLMQVRASFTTGTTAPSQFQLTLPNSLVIDSTKIASNSLVGNAGTSANGTLVGLTVLATGGNAYLQMGDWSPSANASLTPQTGSAIFGNAAAVSLFAEIPITGWSSNTVSSADFAGRTIAATAHSTSGTSCPASTPTTLNFDTVDTDSAGSVTTGSSWKYTASTSGYYQISSSITTASTTWSAGTNIYLAVLVNGTTRYIINNQYTYATLQINLPLSGTITLKLNAGDFVSIQAFQATAGAVSMNANFGIVNINRLPDTSAVVQATETVAARYTDTSGTSFTSGGNPVKVPFATKDYDSHGAVTSGKFTAPVSGKFKFDVRFTATGTGGGTTYFMKNGATLPANSYAKGGAASAQYNASDTFQLNAGDTMEIYFDNANTCSLSTGGGAALTVLRVGN